MTKITSSVVQAQRGEVVKRHDQMALHKQKCTFKTCQIWVTEFPWHRPFLQKSKEIVDTNLFNTLQWNPPVLTRTHKTQYTEGKWRLLMLMHNCFTWATLCLVLLVMAMLMSVFKCTLPNRLHVQQSTCGFISLSKVFWQLICYLLKGDLHSLDVSLTSSSFNSGKITSGSVNVSQMGCLTNSK